MGGNEKIRPSIMFRRHIQTDFTLLKIKTKFINRLYFMVVETKTNQRRTRDESI